MHVHAFLRVSRFAKLRHIGTQTRGEPAWLLYVRKSGANKSGLYRPKFSYFVCALIRAYYSYRHREVLLLPLLLYEQFALQLQIKRLVRKERQKRIKIIWFSPK